MLIGNYLPMRQMHGYVHIISVRKQVNGDWFKLWCQDEPLD